MLLELRSLDRGDHVHGQNAQMTGPPFDSLRDDSSSVKK